MHEFELVEKRATADVHEYKGFLDRGQIPAVMSKDMYFFIYKNRHGEIHCGRRRNLREVQSALKRRPSPIGVVRYKSLSVGSGARIVLADTHFYPGYVLRNYPHLTDAAPKAADPAPNAEEMYRKGVHAALAKAFVEDTTEIEPGPDVYMMTPAERLAYEDQLYREKRDAALRAAFGG